MVFSARLFRSEPRKIDKSSMVMYTHLRKNLLARLDLALDTVCLTDFPILEEHICKEDAML